MVNHVEIYEDSCRLQYCIIINPERLSNIHVIASHSYLTHPIKPLILSASVSTEDCEMNDISENQIAV
jgi:hypothetical protein